MAPPPRAQLSYNESDIVLASRAIDLQQLQSSRRAASTYGVPKSTLNNRRARKLAWRNCQPNSKKLTIIEEEVIVSYIIKLDLRRFAPTYAAVRDMANRLLAARSADQVGVH